MAITTVHNELIAVNAISGTAIADNAVTSVHIAQNNVGTVQIALNSVTSVSIALNQVTGTQIANNAITSTQLADNAVTATKIPDGTQLTLGATTIAGFTSTGIDDNADATAIRIDSSERVGIGRVPSLTNSKLEVGGADNVSLINVEASGATAGIGIGSSKMKFYYGGAEKMTLDGSGNLAATGTLGVSNGTASLPSLTFAGDTNTGLFLGAADQLNFAIGGQDKAFFSATQLNVTGNGVYNGTNLKITTTEGTANDRSGAGFLANGSSTDSSRYAIMWLDADNGAFGTGDSGTYFYIQKTGGAGHVQFIQQDDADVFFTTNGAHKRLMIKNDGKIGIGVDAPAGMLHVGKHTSSVASIFEGNGNGDTVPVQLKVKANNGTTTTHGLYGNAGSASTDNTITLGANGTTGLTIDNLGNLKSSQTGGHVQIDNGVGVTVRETMAATGHAWQANTYNVLSAGAVSIGSDSSNSSHMWWNTYDTGSKYNVSTGYGADMYLAKSTGDFVIRMGSVNAASNGAAQTLTEAFKITKNGIVSIGNSATGAATDFIIMPTAKLYLDAGGDTYISEDAANQMAFFTGGAKRFALIGGAGFFSGTVTASHSFSDERLKENITVIPNALDKIKTLRGITFTRKSDGSSGTGLIAQELEKVLPDAVYETKTMSDDDDTEYKAITYEVTVGLLVEGIKEQQTIIDDLKARIKTLEE